MTGVFGQTRKQLMGESRYEMVAKKSEMACDQTTGLMVWIYCQIWDRAVCGWSTTVKVCATKRVKMMMGPRKTYLRGHYEHPGQAQLRKLNGTSHLNMITYYLRKRFRPVQKRAGQKKSTIISEARQIFLWPEIFTEESLVSVSKMDQRILLHLCVLYHFQ